MSGDYAGEAWDLCDFRAVIYGGNCSSIWLRCEPTTCFSPVSFHAAGSAAIAAENSAVQKKSAWEAE